MNKEEEKIASSFILASHRPRVVALLGSKKGRERIRAQLAHCSFIDMRFATCISPSHQTPDDIYTLLRKKGAPDGCYIIAEAPALDGQSLQLKAALEQIVGSGQGAILSCIPGVLAYYEGEDAGERYVLERRTKQKTAEK